VYEAHRLVYHSTLGLRVIKKNKKNAPRCKTVRAPTAGLPCVTASGLDPPVTKQRQATSVKSSCWHFGVGVPR